MLEYFTEVVALSADGMSLAVGASQDDNGSSNIDDNFGTVFVYKRESGAWEWLLKGDPVRATAFNADVGDGLGASVALSQDGSFLVVGATGEDSGARGIGGNYLDDCSSTTPRQNCALDSGAVYTYMYNTGTAKWEMQSYIKAPNTGAEFVGFGAHIDTDNNGETIAVGTINEASAAEGIGGNSNYDCNADPIVNCAQWSGVVYLY